VNYGQALRYLSRHINLEATAGRVEGLSLSRMRELVGAMGDPQTAYPVIHVTGTNGKGSTVHLITQMLKASGLRVGTYTSPHVERYNERIRLDGVPLDDEAFAEAIADVALFEDVIAQKPSHFELLTAAAFSCFAREAVDVAVVEVGLLGRYDATNVVDAAVAVVTNVQRDHTDGEGEWRARVAYEKAGIIRPGSTLVLGETADELRATFLAEQPAIVYERNRDFAVERNDLALGGRILDVRTPFARHEDLFVRLHGRHQGDNVAVAITAVESFFDKALPEEVLAEAAAQVKVPGRFEILRRDPLVVVDAAHNPDGARTTTATLADFGPGRTRYLVLGMLQGRDIEAMLEAFGVSEAELVIATAADSPRAVPAEEIGRVAAALGADVEVIGDVPAAVRRAMSLAGEDDVVLIAGSFYVIGPARELLRRRS
jgi:dihydrofolate synthase/folylpolyglutamate synthase